MFRSDLARPLRALLFLVDLALLAGAFGLGYWLKFYWQADSTEGDYGQLLGVFVGAWLVVVYLSGGVGVGRLSDLLSSLGHVLRLLVLHVLLIGAYVAFSKGYLYSREQLLYTYLIAAPALMAWRVCLILGVRAWHRAGHGLRRVAVWGQGPTALSLAEFFGRHPETGLRLVVQFAMGGGELGVPVQAPELGRLAQLKRELQLTDLYVTLPGPPEAELNELIEQAENLLLTLHLVPDFGAFEVKNLSIELYDHLPVLAVQQHPLDQWGNRALKRAFDIVFSIAFLLVVGSWLFPLLALLVRLSGPGPIFFRQRRHGLRGEEFWCYKFRSMRVNAEADSRQARAGDDRITPIGRFMRRSNLDELPQFLNVLQGTMSVVGPRPHMLFQTEHFSQVIDKYMVRHAVKPGITGLAQARGFRGETPTVWHMQSRVKFDRYYVEHWSLWLDLQIISGTIGQMFRGNKNAV